MRTEQLIAIALIAIAIYLFTRPKRTEMFDNGIANPSFQIMDLPLTQTGRPVQKDKGPVDDDSPFKNKDHGYHAVVPFQQGGLSVEPVYEFTPSEVLDLIPDSRNETASHVRQIRQRVDEMWERGQLAPPPQNPAAPVVAQQQQQQPAVGGGAP
jgi:hypothetical protein